MTLRKPYSEKQQEYIDSVDGNAHMSAVGIIGELEARDKEHLAKIEKMERQCSVNLIAFNKASAERFVLKKELATLQKSIEDAPVIEIEWDEDGNLFESKSGGFIEYEGFVKGGKPHIPIKVRLVEPPHDPRKTQ